MSGHNREGITPAKRDHAKEAMFGNATQGADAYLDRFTDVDLDRIQELTGKKISALLVDIDACTARPYGPILEENIAHFRKLLDDGVKIGVNSNCKSTERLQPLIDMKIPIYDGEISKPEKPSFINACKMIDSDPAETFMVGDNPNTDGGAIGVLGGMIFLKAIPEKWSEVWAFAEKSPIKKITKTVSVLAQKLTRAIAIKRTLKLNPTIIRSFDI